MALEQGREVYVVPGRVTDRLSDGCNKLLKQGAGVFLSPEDLITELNSLLYGKGVPVNVDTAELNRDRGNGAQKEGNDNQDASNQYEDKELAAVWKHLDFYPKSMEQIGEEMNETCTYPEIVAALMKLCMDGEALQAGNGYFMKKKP
jgi:DNA processing protein